MNEVLVDGVVFETCVAIGIWRMFFETMDRISSKANLSLWLRNKELQPVPTGVQIQRDCGRWSGPRWKLHRVAQRRLAQAFLPKLKKNMIFHSTYYTATPVQGMTNVVSVYDMILERINLITTATGQDEIRAKKNAIRQATLCVAISHATADDLKRFFPEVEDRVRIIPLGVEHLRPTSSERKSHRSYPKPFVLFVGQRWHYKNFITVIDALAAPNWPTQVTLKVVGPPLATYEWDLLKALGIQDRVESLGRLPDVELQKLYGAALCFVFPSRLEGFGLPTLEAQINGCPAVLSDIPVFREIARDSAVYFDPRLGESLAESVASVLDSNRRQELIEAGYENVKRYSWEKTAQQMLEVYEEAAALGAQ